MYTGSGGPASPSPVRFVSFPAGEGVTGLETWVWSGGATSAVVDATIGAWTVTGSASLVAWSVDPGDGTGAHATDHPGDAEDHALDHDYEIKGTYPLSVTAVWTADVTLSGPGLPPVPVSIGGRSAHLDAPVPGRRGRARPAPLDPTQNRTPRPAEARSGTSTRRGAAQRQQSPARTNPGRCPQSRARLPLPAAQSPPTAARRAEPAYRCPQPRASRPRPDRVTTREGSAVTGGR
ncbi:MAG: hypothetical protein M5T61_14400 [Acidimicrobiia bacterium]|nr:hypothetical protein [Acidimicrobiia bacterium]